LRTGRIDEPDKDEMEANEDEGLCECIRFEGYIEDVISTGAERRSNEGGELVRGNPNDDPFSLNGGAGLNVVDELRWLGEGVNIRLLTTAEGEGGKRSVRPMWCSDDNEGI
jgi:hypothetical protein